MKSRSCGARTAGLRTFILDEFYGSDYTAIDDMKNEYS